MPRQDMENNLASGFCANPQISSVLLVNFLDHTDTDRITFLTVLLGKHSVTFPWLWRRSETLLTGTASQHANNPEI